RRRTIGKDNALPWRLPADTRRMRQLTMGKPLIMGRRTYDSIGRPLEGRTSIVLTRDPSFHPEGVLIARTPDEALALAGKADEAIVFGGTQVFREFLPRADRLYLTEIDATFDGDATFPEIDEAEWVEVERTVNEPDERNAYRYTFRTLDRKKRTAVG
ncbi:MAG: dihydrofolate reductase, partial [Chloroflexi bacterium]|nr:dihydrofolate reductase [Chloroflexota bacterium]